MKDFNLKQWLFENRIGMYSGARIDSVHEDDYTMDEAIEGGLTYEALPDCVKTNFKRNITMSVAFVKKDGTVRHMAFRRSLASYVASDKQKTDAQLNVLKNNNLMNVYDANSYLKNLRASGDSAAAAKSSFRNFKLDNVLAFLCGDKVFDMREQNQIKDRFGEVVYNQLTKSMVAALARDEAEGQDLPNVDATSAGEKMSETVGWATITKPSDNLLSAYLDKLSNYDWEAKGARNINEVAAARSRESELKTIYSKLDSNNKQKALDAYIQKAEKLFPQREYPMVARRLRTLTTNTFDGI